MLQASMSTVLLAVVTTNLFLVLLTLCLRSPELLIRAGYKLLALFVVFSLLRILVPLEFPFTTTLTLPLFLSRIIVLFYNRLFSIGGYSVSLWKILKAVWGIGIVWNVIRYALSYYKASHYITLYGKDISKQEPYYALLDCICVSQHKPNRFRVLEMPGLKAPVLFGILSPRILVPEHFNLPDRDISYVLRHECFHYFHHDLLLKNIIKLVTIVYWWNPFCILLNRQTELILEMRIDDCVTLTDAENSLEYMQCLIDVSERAAEQTCLPHAFTMSLLPFGRSDLHQRFLLLTTNQKKRKHLLNIVLLGVTVSLYLLSYTFIPEGYCSSDILIPLTSGTADTEADDIVVPLSINNTYLIDNGDGTYDVYLDYQYMETTTSPELYPWDAPVYTKDTCPY
jgi:beta-lactamase regulating signal transducer with metallopeptidase domain